MSTNKKDLHNKLVRDQFTEIIDQFAKQAIPFANMLAHSNEESTNLLIKMSKLSASDTVLDVACGPGLLSCALAPYVRKVTGIDIVSVTIP